MRTSLIVGLSIAAAASKLALAELPPLSQADRLMFATTIVEAEVLRVRTKDSYNRAERGRDRHYYIHVDVTDVVRGDELNVGDQIKVYGWEALTRPNNWAGSRGNYFHYRGKVCWLGQIPRGAQIVLYLTREQSGRYKILEPNGLVYPE